MEENANPSVGYQIVVTEKSSSNRVFLSCHPPLLDLVSECVSDRRDYVSKPHQASFARLFVTFGAPSDSVNLLASKFYYCTS
jgi:hypothetical protein